MNPGTKRAIEGGAMPAARLRPARAPARAGRLALTVVLWGLATAAGAMDPREAKLFAALDHFDVGDRSGGLEALYRVTDDYPDFLAARVIQASLLKTEDLAATLVEVTPGARPGTIEKHRDEAHARLSYWFDRPAPGYLPEVLIEAGPGRTKVIVADTAHSRLYLFERIGGEWTIRGDWYASIGQGGTAKRREGDRKTPLGVYFVTMWVADRYLPELYGSGALGLNYPNEWDVRRRRDGYGIWIHGEPRGLNSRARRWSLGCLTVSNGAIEFLAQAVERESIPVIIGERLRWLEPSEHDRQRREWLARVADLRGEDTASPDLGVYGYPVGAGDDSTMILVELPAKRRGKRWWQYWRENGDGVWRIAHEGLASFRDIHLKGLPARMPRGGVHRYVP